MKNYIIKFMDKSFIAVTAETAAKIAKDWQSGVAAIMINGNLKATHQICAIDRIDRDTEKDLCQMEGIDPTNAPRIETFLSPNLSSNKQLPHGLNR